MNSKIDLDRVWDDARAMGSANRDLLVAIAGMFVLLPGVVASQLVKLPEEAPKDLPMEEMLRQTMQFYTDNWAVLLGLTLCVSFGLLAMLALLLRPERLTVGESLKAALILLPGYFAATLLQGFGLSVGFMLFFLPGLYLLARLCLIAPVAAAEQQVNPLVLLQRSFALTRGNGWRILIMLLILYCTGWIVNFVLTRLVGLIVILLMPKDIAELCVAIASGAVDALLAIFVALIPAAIYRAKVEPAPTPWLPDSGI
ncbi:MAG: hypothetical protein J7494_01285 [Sphingobium sp.]|nr:hypothetical protein [Sphingobium sp.]